MRVLVASVLVAGLLVGLPTVAAQEEPCRAVLENATSDTTGPGDALDAAIGSQSEQIGRQFSDRWFDAQLANASTPAGRATFLAEVVDYTRASVDAVEACLESNANTDTATGPRIDLSEEDVETLQRHVRTLHWWVNETRAASDELSEDLRRRYDLGELDLEILEERVVTLRDRLERVHVSVAD